MPSSLPKDILERKAFQNVRFFNQTQLESAGRHCASARQLMHKYRTFLCFSHLMNGPYSSSLVYCLKTRFWGIMVDFRDIIVNNSSIMTAIKLRLGVWTH